MKELEENSTPSSITGMGAVTLPTATQTGSGDVPANSGDAEEEYKKKKKKMKKLLTFESFANKDIVTEGRVKQFTSDLKDMIKNIKSGYGWIDPEFVEDTWENSSDSIDFELVKSEIYRQLIKAGLLAKSDDDNEEEAGEYIKSLKQLGIAESVVTESFVAYTENSKGEYEVVKVLKDQRAAKAWRKKNAYLLDDDSADVTSIGTAPKKDWDKTHPELATESVITEARSIAKIQKEWTNITAMMKDTVSNWKSAKGQEKEDLLDQLKVLTASKKKIEAELDAAVGIKDLNIELAESVVTEAFSRMSKDTIENELYKASQELSKYYDWLKAGNDSGKGKTLDSIISLLKKCKDSIKRFNKPEEVKGTAFESVVTEKFNFSKKEVEAAANLIASAISQADMVKAKVHDLEYDKGRGAGFEISIDGEKYDGGSYVVKDNGDVVNAAIGNKHPNAVYNTIGNKNIVDVFINMEKYESVVNEAATKSAALVQFAADEKAEGKNAEIHLATFDGSGMEAQSTNKTWDDGVPVTKNFTRGGYKRVAPKGKIYIIESNDWWYFEYKGTWYAVKRKDYGTPPFEY
jgi:hypothetical protein